MRPMKAFLCVVALSSLHCPAHAIDIDPFKMNEKSWTSLNQYNDSRDSLSSESYAQEDDPLYGEQPHFTDADDSATLDPESETTAVVSRPVVYPLMPDTKKRGSGDASFSEQRGLDGKPIDDEQWKDARTAVQDIESQGQKGSYASFNVKLSTLPAGRATAQSGAPIIRPHKLMPQMSYARAEKKDSPDNAKTSQEDQKACEALAAHQKKQLQAIESDRQTLNALRAAIAELGVGERLDHLAPDNGTPATPVNEGPRLGEDDSMKKNRSTTDSSGPNGPKPLEKRGMTMR